MIQFRLQEVYCCGKVSKYGGDAHGFSLVYFQEGSPMIEFIAILMVAKVVFELLQLVIGCLSSSVELVDKIQTKKKKQR